MDQITLAGGCFWCTEAIFQKLNGVEKVVSGYCGGNVQNPTYEQVSSGKTGHAESIQITFNPKVISPKTLLEVFFKLHDPTTLNQQGADIGTQYRSAIFYKDEEQKGVAQKAKEEAKKHYSGKILTEIVPLKNFYPAESYHQNYYQNYSQQPLDSQSISDGRGSHGSVYCQIVIDPKIQKLYKNFKNITKGD